MPGIEQALNAHKSNALTAILSHWPMLCVALTLSVRTCWLHPQS